MPTAYEKMRKTIGEPRIGRKPLPEAERIRRAEIRREETRRRMQAKRRAWFVLENKYKEEFERLFREEYEALNKPATGKK